MSISNFNLKKQIAISGVAGALAGVKTGASVLVATASSGVAGGVTGLFLGKIVPLIGEPTPKKVTILGAVSLVAMALLAPPISLAQATSYVSGLACGLAIGYVHPYTREDLQNAYHYIYPEEEQELQAGPVVNDNKYQEFEVIEEDKHNLPEDTYDPSSKSFERVIFD